MIRLFAVALFALLAFAMPSPAQENPPEPPAELLEALGRNALIAGWMSGYDVAAWYSADEFQKEPAEVKGRVRNWFCYSADDGWHAVYGRMDEAGEKYERILHYLVKSPTRVEKQEDLTGKDFDIPLTRALADSGPKLMAKPAARRIRFNPYVRQTETGIEVWAHPNVASDWTIVHGIVFYWEYSRDGTEFRSEKQYGKELHGTKPQKDTPVTIGDPAAPLPPLSEMFVITRFGHLFKEIRVQSKTGFSLMMGGGMWTHVLKPEEKAEAEAEAEEPGESDDDGGE